MKPSLADQIKFIQSKLDSYKVQHTLRHLGRPLVRAEEIPILEAVLETLRGLDRDDQPDIGSAKANGDEGGTLILDQTEDGDVFLTVNQPMQRQLTLRFCTKRGGGKSPNTLKALRALILAIRSENEEQPKPVAREYPKFPEGICGRGEDAECAFNNAGLGMQCETCKLYLQSGDKGYKSVSKYYDDRAAIEAEEQSE